MEIRPTTGAGDFGRYAAETATGGHFPAGEEARIGVSIPYGPMAKPRVNPDEPLNCRLSRR